MYKPELAESFLLALLEDCLPEGYKKLVQSKLQYIPKRKENLAKVLEVMTKAAED